MRTRWPAPVLACLVLVAACGGTPATGEPSIRAADPGELQYTCGRFAFGPELLDVVGHDEAASNPQAIALRRKLAMADMDSDMLPDTGWTHVGDDATTAEYVARAGDLGFVSVALDADANGWHVTGWGDCSPRRVLPDGLGAASWVLAGGQSIGPETTTFDALVTEMSCASGQSSEGRVVGPQVLAAGDLLLVTFAVRDPANSNLTQTCQGNPATRVTVTLAEPLGSRQLKDGDSLPPRDPVPEP